VPEVVLRHTALDDDQIPSMTSTCRWKDSTQPLLHTGRGVPGLNPGMDTLSCASVPHVLRTLLGLPLEVFANLLKVRGWLDR
jgi:hypothetical protein